MGGPCRVPCCVAGRPGLAGVYTDAEFRRVAGLDNVEKIRPGDGIPEIRKQAPVRFQHFGRGENVIALEKADPPAIS